MTEQAPGGWAEQDGHPEPRGPFTTDMQPRGVVMTDMPAPRPTVPRRHVKGVPGATAAADEDHRPGGGTWRPVS
jgi:hypothetical protein